MKAYGIFQGGGAKGVAHIGALRAAEERGITFKGIAGSSIGAVIAALIAAGYTSHEMFSPDGREPAGILDIDPLTVIDEADWKRISAFGTALDKFAGRRMDRFRDKVTNLWLRQVPMAINHRRVIARLIGDLGMTSTKGLTDWLDGLLRAKTTGTGTHGRVTFDDMRIPLRVVAANVVSGQTRIFGGPDDRTVAVADAVAASACYPGVFAPVRLPGGLFVDGGLVSNLPAWVFDAEREEDPAFVPTFGIRFVAEDRTAPMPEEGPSDFISFVKMLMNTAVSGATQLESRAVEDYYPVDLSVDIPTLAFPELRARAPEIIEQGRKDVLRMFETTVGPQDPGRIAEVLRLAAVILRRRLNVSGSIRAYVLMVFGDRRKARVYYSSGMAEDADDRMIIKLDVPGPASPLVMCEPVLVQYKKLNETSGGPFAKYERAMRPSRIISAYSIPIFDDANDWLKDDPATRHEPYAALVIDAPDDLRSKVLNRENEDLLAGLAQVVGEFVRDKQYIRADRSPGHSAADTGGLTEIVKNCGCFVSARKLRDPSDQRETITLVTAIDSSLKALH